MYVEDPKSLEMLILFEHVQWTPFQISGAFNTEKKDTIRGFDKIISAINCKVSCERALAIVQL